VAFFIIGRSWLGDPGWGQGALGCKLGMSALGTFQAAEFECAWKTGFLDDCSGECSGGKSLTQMCSSNWDFPEV